MRHVSLEADRRDLDLGILMVPLRGDTFEGEAEGLALPWSERRNIEVYRFGVGPVTLENFERDIFALRQLSHFVFEYDLEGNVRDGLRSRIGDRSVDVADSCANEIFRSAHFEIGELEACGVGRRTGCSLRLTPKKHRDDSRQGEDHHHCEHDDAGAGAFFFGCWRRLRESAHTKSIIFSKLTPIRWRGRKRRTLDATDQCW